MKTGQNREILVRMQAENVVNMCYGAMIVHPGSWGGHAREKYEKVPLTLHSQCVTNIEASQSFSSWSNVGRLRFDQHLVK